MLSSYVLKTVAKPKQILLGDQRATVLIFLLSGLAMIFSWSPVIAAIIVGIFHPVNIWLTRRDPFYVDVFVKAWVPLVWSMAITHLAKHNKESLDA